MCVTKDQASKRKMPSNNTSSTVAKKMVQKAANDLAAQLMNMSVKDVGSKKAAAATKRSARFLEFCSALCAALDLSAAQKGNIESSGHLTVNPYGSGNDKKYEAAVEACTAVLQKSKSFYTTNVQKLSSRSDKPIKDFDVFMVGKSKSMKAMHDWMNSVIKEL